MPASRNLRIGRHSQSGHAYLLTVGCHQRAPLLSDVHAARIVCDTLLWLDRQERAKTLALVVMPDHVHWVAILQSAPLHALMHSFKSFSAQQINETLRRRGPLWQAGYHDHALRSDQDLQPTIDYCLQNPVRAGLVADHRDYPHTWCKWP